MLLNLFKYVVFYETLINIFYVIKCFIYIVISHTLVFLYGCNVPELSYLIELKLNSDVLTKCLTFYILFYIFILCYNLFKLIYL